MAATPDRRGPLLLPVSNRVDSTETTFDAAGKVVTTKLDVKARAEVKPSKDVSKLPKDKLIADLAVQQVLPGPTAAAVTYWGGMLQIFHADGTLKDQQMIPQDVAAMAWQGDNLVVGLAEGAVMSLRAN